MGGVKDAILLAHDQIETAITEALPERIYQRIEINNDATALVISGWDFITVIAEVSLQSGTVVVHTKPQYAQADSAIFRGGNANEAAGRYIAYLMECDE
jgi:hypothetical protein